MKEMSVHPGGSLVLMFCLDIVDDTVLLRKQVTWKKLKNRPTSCVANIFCVFQISVV